MHREEQEQQTGMWDTMILIIQKLQQCCESCSFLAASMVRFVAVMENQVQHLQGLLEKHTNLHSIAPAIGIQSHPWKGRWIGHAKLPVVFRDVEL
eukprot:g33429.t1